MTVTCHSLSLVRVAKKKSSFFLPSMTLPASRAREGQVVTGGSRGCQVASHGQHSTLRCHPPASWALAAYLTKPHPRSHAARHTRSSRVMGSASPVDKSRGF